MRVNLTYIISQVSHSNVFEWTASHIDRKKYKLSFILMNAKESALEEFLCKQGFSVHRIDYKNKFDIPLAIVRIRKILKKEKTDIVHTHLFEAGLAGMTAAKLAGISKRIHTRHDATIHHDYHPHAVKYDKIINNLSTHLIAITKNVRNILVELEGVNENKISIVHHGFKLDEFDSVSEERTSALRKKYFPSGIPYPVIGVVSRFIEWKGIHYIIPAFIEFRKKNPSAHLVLANATGPYEKEIDILLKQLPPSSYTKIIFEPDIIALYRFFDFFVHVPVDQKAEAFGQVYIEALASKVPSVVTLSGIAPDFIENGIHAMVVPFRDANAITESLEKLMNDKKLQDSISAEAKLTISKLFQIDQMIQSLETIYDA